MWRLRSWSMRSFVGVQRRLKASSSFTGGNSFTDGAESRKDGQLAHPLLYSVPVMSPRTVGRDAEVMALWQNLLAGRHCQLLTGVDGVGKSTLAAEFADCARRSQRFSCIQWFNARANVHDQLKQFFLSMKGRSERDVLLILDDAPDPASLVSQLPEHANVHYMLTSSATDVVASDNKVVVTQVEPLTEAAAEAFGAEVELTEPLRDVFYTLGYVPLLLEIASHLVEAGVVSAEQLLQILREKRVRDNDTLSISQALRVLVDTATEALEKAYPNARDDLATLACFHVNDVSDVIIAAVVGDEAASQFGVLAAQHGILSLRWEDSAFALHPSVAILLRQTGDIHAHVRRAADALLKLWPRRWRNMGNHLAFALVWHTRALYQVCTDDHIPPPDSLLQSMDRSATFLAHVETRELNVAAQLWGAIVQHRIAANAPPSADAARIAREYGRLLHYLRRADAEAALQTAYQWSCTAYGEEAAETALVMACLAPYLPGSDQTLARLTVSVRALEERLESVDVVLGPEETRMALESEFVLLMCKGQILQEMKRPVPDSLWAALESIEARLKRAT